MTEKLKMHSSNKFITEFVINICELKTSICENIFAERFLNFFVIIAFTNLLRFEFIKIINWFNCETLSFSAFFKTFQSGPSVLCFNSVEVNFYLFVSNTQLTFELRVFVEMKNNFAVFAIFALVFFCFFFDRADVRSHCVFFSAHDTFHVKIIYFYFAHFCVMFFLRIIHK